MHNWVKALLSCTQRNDGGHTSIDSAAESKNKPNFIYLQGEWFVRLSPDSKGSKHTR